MAVAQEERVVTKLPILIWPVRPIRKYFRYLFLRSTYVDRLNIPNSALISYLQNQHNMYGHTTYA